MKEITIYMVASPVKYPFMTVENEKQALEFCEDNNWEWMDENGFVWDLEY